MLAQKLDRSTLSTNGMIGALVSVADRYKRTRYFEVTFLVSDLSRDIVLGMLFVLADFSWKNYTTANALVATKQAEIVDAKIFSQDALDPKLSMICDPCRSDSSHKEYASGPAAQTNGNGG